VITDVLQAARAGDEPAFDRLVAPHRAELRAHCYRMLGSLHDAEDALQETLLRAWRGLARFEERSSLRSWLYRIATNCCLRLIERRPKRVLPLDYGPAADPHDALAPPLVESVWVEPFPDDALAAPEGMAGPDARYEQREAIELAFVAAMQHLPARQRAILLMREVLGWSAAEAADALETTPAAVNSGLQRARARLDALGIGADHVAEPVTAEQRTVVDRYVTAFVAGDLAAVGQLLAQDVVLEMPPVPAWYRGPDDYVAFLAHVFDRRGTDWQMVPVRSNGQAAVAAYVRESETYRLHSLQVFTVSAGRVAGTMVFTDPATLAMFAVPAELVRTGGTPAGRR